MMGLGYSVGLALATIIVVINPLLSVVDHLHVLPIERAFPLNQPVHNLDSVRARDQARHARMLQGVVDFSVHGSSDPFRGGIYYTKVKLGSPAREYYVQIDTGSDVMWVGCSSCSNCPRTSQLDGGIGLNLYDSAASSTANPVSCSDPICTNKYVSSCLDQTNQCGYSFHYGDGSATSGYYVSDDIHFNIILDQSLDANSSASITFGCTTYQSGDLVNTDKAVDGIIGFGPGPMSVISQLSSRAIFPRVFSHCLKGGPEGGGAMIIGGHISDPNIVYTPLVPSRPHYNLKMMSIGINGQLLAVDPAVFETSNNKGTIVDSGTTLTYLVQEAFDPFVSAVNALVAHEVVTPVTLKGTQCYLAGNTSDTILKKFPYVTLNFDGGVSMHLKPEEYLVPIDSIEGSPTWCIGFQRTEHGVSILGDLVLKDKIIVYDLAQQQIGWTNYNCSLPMNISTGFDRDKFIYNTDFSASQLVKESICLCLLIASLFYFLCLSW